jgi:hypothetical protein
LVNFGEAKHADIELDTIDIIEGMAVAFEIYSFHIDQNESQAKKRLNELSETQANKSYLHAIQIFLAIMGLSIKPLRHDDVARMAVLFLAIAEMSLNPPLPPFGIINRLELDWNKIYPPLRFIDLCHIAKRVIGESEYIPGPTPTAWIPGAWFLDCITQVESLYLAQGGALSYLSKEEDGYLPNEKSVPFLALIAKENPIMREILSLFGINTIGMAEKFPEVIKGCAGLELYAILRDAHTLFMNYFGTPRPFLIPFEFDSGRDALYKAPLTVFNDSDYKDPFYDFGWSKNFAQYLIQRNLFITHCRLSCWEKSRLCIYRILQ